MNHFFGNLLLGESFELKNRNLKVNIKDSSNDVGEMSERGRRILELITENNAISAKQLAERLNTTNRTIEREIRKMKESKIIERIGGDRGGFWNITKK